MLDKEFLHSYKALDQVRWIQTEETAYDATIYDDYVMLGDYKLTLTGFTSDDNLYDFKIFLDNKRLFWVTNGRPHEWIADTWKFFIDCLCNPEELKSETITEDQAKEFLELLSKHILETPSVRKAEAEASQKLREETFSVSAVKPATLNFGNWIAIGRDVTTQKIKVVGNPFVEAADACIQVNRWDETARKNHETYKHYRIQPEKKIYNQIGNIFYDVVQITAELVEEIIKTNS